MLGSAQLGSASLSLSLSLSLSRASAAPTRVDIDGGYVLFFPGQFVTD